MTAPRLLLPACLAALALLPASASATTFCVPTFSAACPNDGTTVAQASLETAMSTSGSDGTADTIVLGPGVFSTTSTFTPTGTDALTVVGQGAGASFLTSSSGANVFVVSLTGRGPTLLRDLSIVVGESFPTDNGSALNADAGTILRDVEVELRNPPSAGGTGSYGLTFNGGISSLERVRIAPSGSGALATALDVGSATPTGLTATQLTIEQPRVTAIRAESGSPVTASRVVVVGARSTAVLARPATVTLTNLLLTMAADTPPVAATSPSATASSVTLDHATIVSSAPGATTPPVAATAQSTGGATVTVTNSIVSGFAGAGQRSATGVGPARIALSASHVPGVVGAAGPGSTSATDMVLSAPTFADPAGFDFSLAAGSAGVDAGTPGTASPTVDLNGNPRVLDGNGDGTAIRDIGAYERPAPPPAPAPQPSPTPTPTPAPGTGTPGTGTVPGPGGGTTAVPADTTAPETIRRGGPGSRLRRGIATFRFGASERGVRFQCRLDGGRARTCTSPLTLRRLRAGRHVLRVRAIDAAGNADRTPLVLRFAVPRRR